MNFGHYSTTKKAIILVQESYDAVKGVGKQKGECLEYEIFEYYWI